MIVRLTVIYAFMVDPVRVIYANVIGNITVCVVTFSSRTICWKLIRKEGNYRKRVHSPIVTNGFPTIMEMKCQYINAMYTPVK